MATRPQKEWEAILGLKRLARGLRGKAHPSTSPSTHLRSPLTHPHSGWVLIKAASEGVSGKRARRSFCSVFLPRLLREGALRHNRRCGPNFFAAFKHRSLQKRLGRMQTYFRSIHQGKRLSKVFADFLEPGDSTAF